MLQELLQHLLGSSGQIPPAALGRPGDPLPPQELGAPGLMALLGQGDAPQPQPMQDVSSQSRSPFDQPSVPFQPGVGASPMTTPIFPSAGMEMAFPRPPTQAQSEPQPQPQPQQPPQDISSQRAPQQSEGGLFSSLFGGEGGDFGNFLGRLGPTLMIMSGDPRYTQAGAAMLGQHYKQAESRKKQREELRRQNVTFEWLKTMVKSPEEARAILANPVLLKEFAKRAYAKKDKPPTSYQEYKLEQEDPGYAQRRTELKERGATRVDARQMGTIPPGYQVEYDDQDRPIRMRPIPGGPAAAKAEEAEAKRRAKETTVRHAGRTVLRSVTRSLDDFLPNVVQAEGVVGANARAAKAAIKGTPEANLVRQVEDFSRNIGLDRLQAMREQSPTGGALGQVPVQQQIMLQETLGSFDITQPISVLKENLRQLNNIYLDIMFGSKEERTAAVEQGRISSEMNAEIDKMYYETEFDVFGRRRKDRPNDGGNLPTLPPGFQWVE